jgi:hypothetical protein
MFCLNIYCEVELYLTDFMYVCVRVYIFFTEQYHHCSFARFRKQNMNEHFLLTLEHNLLLFDFICMYVCLCLFLLNVCLFSISIIGIIIIHNLIFFVFCMSRCRLLSLSLFFLNVCIVSVFFCLCL